MNAITGVLLGLLGVSFALLAVSPESVTSTRYGGAWLSAWQFHAVFSHKSDAGYYFAALSLILAHGTLLQSRPVLRAALVGIAFFAILLANSATALTAAVLLNALLVVVNRADRLRHVILPLAGAATLVFSIAAPLIDFGSLAGFLGRDVELTGRIPIWRAGFAFANDRPFLGHGYYAFFHLGPYSPAWDLWKTFAYFRTPHFHNSALDILIGFGAVGLVCYVALLGCGFTVLANVTIAPRNRNLLAAVLILFLISAAFDFTLMKHNAFATTFLAYLLVTAQRRQNENPPGEPDGSG